MRQVFQPLRGDRAEFVQQPLVVAHEMAGGVHAEYSELGVEPSGVVQVRQVGGCDRVPGPAALAQRQLPLRRTQPAALQLGEVQKQIVAIGSEGVQGADPGKTFADRSGRPGPGDEVLERAVRAPRDDPLRFALAHPVYVAQGESNAGDRPITLIIRHQFDFISDIRHIHLQGQDRHPHRRASASSSRFGYIPGSCVRRPA